jgi:hypothetical protein
MGSSHAHFTDDELAAPLTTSLLWNTKTPGEHGGHERKGWNRRSSGGAGVGTLLVTGKPSL